MPLLLLQAATTTTFTSLLGVYIALGGTLAAALLSALSSWNAAKTAKGAAVLAASTAEKVADLSSQTSREVAGLSAQVSRESAGLAAQTAREIKEIDYKYDFYKRIIEKRLIAWEEAMQFIAQLVTKSYDRKDDKKFPNCFLDIEKLDKILKKMISLEGPTLWIGDEYNNLLRQFHAMLVSARHEAVQESSKNPFKSLEILVEDSVLREVGKKFNKEYTGQVDKMTKELGKRLVDLHQVEPFFNRLKHLGADE